MATPEPSQPANKPQGFVRLCHGTDLGSASDMSSTGLDPAKAAVFNATGEFWATTDRALADMFAQVNPAGGTPARFDFDVPAHVLGTLLGSNPPRAYQHGNDTYEF